MSNLLKIDADRLNIEDIVEKIQSGMGGFNPTVGLPLFSYIWCDHFLDDDNFVRSDDFSWHNGLKYKKAYQHLVDDMANVQMTTWYAFTDNNIVLYTTEERGEIITDVVVYDSPNVINEYYTNDVGMIWYDDYILSGKGKSFYRDSTRDIKISQHETETIGDITISFYRAEDGHKICLSDQEDNLQELYETTGISWYYLIDVENKLFKLPRTKYGFTGIRDGVGDYVDESLPNITGEGTVRGFANDGNHCVQRFGDGALYEKTRTSSDVGAATGSFTSTFLIMGFDASRSSSTYQDGAPVQQRATQMYLYFFLGNGSSETEYEMNILKGGLELGDIGIAPFGIDESQNKRRYLNGQLINQTQFKEFTSLIKERISLYPSIATTEENWQAEVTNSALGQCGKFVVDDDLGTIRLPKVVNVQGLADLQYLGNKLDEALPNITGHTGNPKTLTNTLEIGTPEGCFYVHSSTSNDFGHTAQGSSGRWALGFDASLSSDIYKDNAHVQQEAIQYPYFIQVSVGSSLINGTPYINDVENLKSTSLRTSTITNCITEIPQDIKLELNNGTLTLKAGSKVYVPNDKNADGSNKFDEVVTTQDLSATAQSLGLVEGDGLLYCMPDSSSIWVELLNESGTTNPPLPWTTYYNTSENKVYRFASSNTTSAHQGSFPIAKVSFSNSTLTSINQVFNGFGYIGSMVFALPGVKGLIPNGRNEDGSLRNIEFVTRKVSTIQALTGTFAFGIKGDNRDYIVGIYGDDIYDDKLNIISYQGVVYPWMFSGSLIFSNNTITSFTPKQPFQAVDYNDAVKYSDKAEVVGWIVPDYSARVSKTKGTTYTAETHGWLLGSDVYDSTGGASAYVYIDGFNVRVSGNQDNYTKNTWCYPISKGSTYSFNGTSSMTLYFVPCKGVK